MSLSLIICPVEPALLLTRCSDLLFGYGSKAVAVVEVLIQVNQSSPLCVPSSGPSPQSDLARPSKDCDRRVRPADLVQKLIVPCSLLEIQFLLTDPAFIILNV
jgi:hypothetical protein